MFLKTRYLLLLMGFFATYCGLIYNDFMSIPLTLFGSSCYAGEKQTCVYPFGIDPVWMSSKNDISFYNGFKMKTSVIFAIMQMTLGTILKGCNAIHFKRHLELFHEVIPQIILTLGLFGFMDFLIIQKWLTDYSGREIDAPSIITTMISMFLGGGEGVAPVIRHQKFWGGVSCLIAVVCPPWMLFVRPLILKK